MVIGITGNFGVGKTTVANMFRRLGARVIDADHIAHMIIKPYTPAYNQIIATFGRGILSGIYISRKKLAKQAFSDEQKLRALNRITHPKIARMIKDKAKKVAKDEILVIDAALLIESGLPPHQLLKKRVIKRNWCGGVLPCIDKLIVVKCESNIQMQRLKKGNLTANEIKRRLRFQSPQNEKISFADFVVDNNGRKDQTEKQVSEIWNRIIYNIGGEKWKS